MIADIGGYTKFMKLHRVSLAHAEDITRRLLRAVVESSPLPLIEIEGDAVFFSAPLGQVDANAAALSLAMHQRFHSQLERMIALNMCSCDACMQSRNLKVKFVGHVGEVATQKIGGHEKLVGVDVIAVHRMLKNAVPVPEYVLMTEPLYEQCEDQIRVGARMIEEDLDGLGPTSPYFVDLDRIALDPSPPPKPTLPRRLGETMGVALRGFPTVVGLRRSRRLS
ncbi:MAG: hypothetical protein AUG48_07640 [Actinobacteria bacterium 13_1_20CM_3_68_9]|nr:MAG: hypothetical protein AUG48_07640 [Actinobacteria bacterium 13_1_20CM_3_68_9]